MEWGEFLAGILVAVALVAAGALGGYVLLRRWFERAAYRVADDLGRTLADLSRGTGQARRPRAATTGSRPPLGYVTRMDAYAAAEGISPEEARREFAASIERTARLMDAAVRLPVIGPVGLDPVLGLFPVAGDVISAAIGVSLIARSIKYGVPPEIIARMLANVMADVLLGAVPVVGDLADMWFRANTRNVALLREYLESDTAATLDTTVVRRS